MTIGSNSRSSQGGGQADSAARATERDQMFQSAFPHSPCEIIGSPDLRSPCRARLYDSGNAPLNIPPLVCCHPFTGRAACRSSSVEQTPHALTAAYLLQQQEFQEQPMSQAISGPPQQFKSSALARQPHSRSRRQQGETQHRDSCTLVHQGPRVHLERQQNQQQQSASIHQQTTVSAPGVPVHQQRSSSLALFFREPRVQNDHQDCQQVRSQQQQREWQTVESAGSAPDLSIYRAFPAKGKHISCMSPYVRFPTYSSFGSFSPWQHQQKNHLEDATGGRRLSRGATTELATTHSPRFNIPCNLVVPRMIFSHHCSSKGTSSRLFSSPDAASIPGVALTGPVADTEIAVAVAAPHHQSARTPAAQEPQGVNLRTTTLETAAAADGCAHSASRVSSGIAFSREESVSYTKSRLGSLSRVPFAAHFSTRMPAFSPLQPDAASGTSSFSHLLPSSVAETRTAEAPATEADGRGLECVGRKPQQRPVASMFSTGGSTATLSPCKAVVASQRRADANLPALMCPRRSPAVSTGTTDSLAAGVSCPLDGRTAAAVSPLDPGDQKSLQRNTLRLPLVIADSADAAGSSSTGSAERRDHKSAPRGDTPHEEQLVYFPLETTINSPSAAAITLDSVFPSHCFKETRAAASVGASRPAGPSAVDVDDFLAEEEAIDTSRISEAGPPSWQCPPVAASAWHVDRMARPSTTLVDRSCWTGCDSTSFETTAGSPDHAVVAGSHSFGLAGADALSCAAASAYEVAVAERSAGAPTNNSSSQGEGKRETVTGLGEGCDCSSISSSISTETTSSKSCSSNTTSGMSNVSSVLLARECKPTSGTEKGTCAFYSKPNYVYFCDAKFAESRTLEAPAAAAARVAVATRRESVAEFCDGAFGPAVIVYPPPSTSSKDPSAQSDSRATAGWDHATEAAQHAIDTRVNRPSARKLCEMTATVTVMRSGAPVQPRSSSSERGLEGARCASSTAGGGGIPRSTGRMASRGCNGDTFVNGGNDDKLTFLTLSNDTQTEDTKTSDRSAPSEKMPAPPATSLVTSAHGTTSGRRGASSLVSEVAAAAPPSAIPLGGRNSEKVATNFPNGITAASQAGDVSLVRTPAPADVAAADAASGSFRQLATLTQHLLRPTAESSAMPQPLISSDGSAGSAAIACIDGDYVKSAATLQASDGVRQASAPEGVFTCLNELAEGTGGGAAAETSVERVGRARSREVKKVLSALIEVDGESILSAALAAADDSSAASSDAHFTATSRSSATSFLAVKSATGTAGSSGREATVSQDIADDDRHALLDIVNPAAERVAAGGTPEKALRHRSVCASSSSPAASALFAAAVCRPFTAPAMIVDSVTTTIADAPSSQIDGVFTTTAEETPSSLSPQATRLHASSMDASFPLSISAARNAPMTLFKLATTRSVAPSSSLTNLERRTSIPAHACPDGATAARPPHSAANQHHQQQQQEKPGQRQGNGHTAASVAEAAGSRDGVNIFPRFTHFWKDNRFKPFLRNSRNTASMASSGAGCNGAEEEAFYEPAFVQAVLSSLLPTPLLPYRGAPAVAAARSSPLMDSTAHGRPTVMAKSSVCSSFFPFLSCGTVANRGARPALSVPPSCAAAGGPCKDCISPPESAVGFESHLAPTNSDGAATSRRRTTSADACDASNAGPRSGAANAIASYRPVGPAAKTFFTAGSSDAAEDSGETLEIGVVSKHSVARRHHCWRLAADAALAVEVSGKAEPLSSSVMMFSQFRISPASFHLLKGTSFQRRCASAPASPVSHPASDPKVGEHVFLPLRQQQLPQPQQFFPQPQLHQQQQVMDQQQLFPRPLPEQQQCLHQPWQLLPLTGRKNAAFAVVPSRTASSPPASAVDSKSQSALLAAAAEPAGAAAVPAVQACDSRSCQAENRSATSSHHHGTARSGRCRCRIASDSGSSSDMMTKVSAIGAEEGFSSHKSNETINEVNYSRVDFVPVDEDSATNSGKADCRYRRSTFKSVSAELPRDCSNDSSTSSNLISFASCASSVSESNTRSSSRGSPRSSSCNSGPQSSDRSSTTKTNSRAATGRDTRRLHAEEVKRNDDLAAAPVQACLSIEEPFVSPTVDDASLCPVAADPNSRSSAPPTSRLSQDKGSDAVADTDKTLEADRANLVAVPAGVQARSRAAAVKLEEQGTSAAITAGFAVSMVECSSPYRWGKGFDERTEGNRVAVAMASECRNMCAFTALPTGDAAPGSDSSTEDQAAKSPASAADANPASVSSSVEENAAATLLVKMETEAAADGAAFENANDKPEVLLEESTTKVDEDLRLSATAAAVSSQAATAGVLANREPTTLSACTNLASGDPVSASWSATARIQSRERMIEDPVAAVAEPEVRDQSASVPVDTVEPSEAATSREGSSIDLEEMHVSRSSDVRCSESSSYGSSTHSCSCFPSPAPASRDCHGNTNATKREATAVVVIECRRGTEETLVAGAAASAPAQLINGRASASGTPEEAPYVEKERIPPQLADCLLKLSPQNTSPLNRVVAALSGAQDEECCSLSSVYLEKRNGNLRRSPAVGVCVNSRAETGTDVFASFPAASAAADADVPYEEENICRARFVSGWQQGILPNVSPASDFLTSAPARAETGANFMSAQTLAATETHATSDTGAAPAVVRRVAVPIAEEQLPAATFAELSAVSFSVHLGSAAADTVAAAGEAGDTTVCKTVPCASSFGSGESVPRVAGGDSYTVIGAAGDAGDENHTETVFPSGGNLGQVAGAAPVEGLGTAAIGLQETAGQRGPVACTMEAPRGADAKFKEMKVQEEIEQEDGEEQKREALEAIPEARPENCALPESFRATPEQAQGSTQRGQARPEHTDAEVQEREETQRQNKWQDEPKQGTPHKAEREEQEIEAATGEGPQKKETATFHAQNQRERRDGVTVGASQQEFKAEDPVRLPERQLSAETSKMQKRQTDEVNQTQQQAGGSIGGEKGDACSSRSTVVPLPEHLPERMATAAADDAGKRAVEVAPDGGSQDPLDELTPQLCRQIAVQAPLADGETPKASDEHGSGTAVEIAGLNCNEDNPQEGPQQMQQRLPEQAGRGPLQNIHSGTVCDREPPNAIAESTNAAWELKATFERSAPETGRNSGAQGSAETGDVPATAVDRLSDASASSAAVDREESGLLLRAAASAAVSGEVTDSQGATLQGTTPLAPEGLPTVEGAHGEAEILTAPETPASPRTAGAPVGEAGGDAFAEEATCTVSRSKTVADPQGTQDIGAEEVSQEGVYKGAEMPNDSIRSDSQSGRCHRAVASADDMDKALAQGCSRQEYLAVYERASNQVWYNGNVFNSVQMWVRWLEARETHAFLMQHAEGDEVASLSSSSSSFSSLSGGDDSDSDSCSDSGSDGDSGSDSDSDGDATDISESPSEHRLRALPIGPPLAPPQPRELRTAGTVNLAVAADGPCHIGHLGVTQQQRQRLRQPQYRPSPSVGFLPNGISNVDAACTLSVSTCTYCY